MRLFHIANSRSTRVLWTLEEINVPYSVTRLTWPARESEAHRRLHPLGKVPVLEFDDGLLLFESAAICLHLADRHPEAELLGPVGSRARGVVYQWVMFSMTEVERLTFAWLRAHRSGEDEAIHGEAFARVADVLREKLSRREWLAGMHFTVADILCASMLRNTLREGLLADEDPLRSYVERALARPANQRADAVDAED